MTDRLLLPIRAARLMVLMAAETTLFRWSPVMTSFDQYVPAPLGRFDGITRPYGVEDVARLRGSFVPEHSLARRGALKLWERMKQRRPGPRARRRHRQSGDAEVRAGLEAIYLCGWQVAADANTAGAMYPDQSLYPANTGPELARRINRTLQRADQIEHSEGGSQARLVRADRRRCRSWFRRAAQLLRDHEGLYRGGRRRGPFRGPARRRKRSAATWAARC